MKEIFVDKKVVDEIFRIVCDYRGVSLSQIKSKNRRRERVYARYEIMYFLKKYTPYSLENIGSLFGDPKDGFKSSKDHSTVIHGIREVKKMKSLYSWYRQEFEPLEKKMSFAMKSKKNKLKRNEDPVLKEIENLRSFNGAGAIHYKIKVNEILNMYKQLK